MEFYKNFLDADLLKEIHTFTNQNWEAYKWRTSHFWDKNIKRHSSPIAINELPEKLFSPIQKYFDLPIYNEKKEKGIMFYVWPPGSYIGWHNDQGYTFGATIYLNKTWNINHGGIFIYSKGDHGIDDGINARLPQYNECVINRKRTSHCISMTTPDAPLRTTLQIFGQGTKNV